MGAPVNGFEKPAPDGQQLQLASSKRNPQSGAASQHCSAVKSGHGVNVDLQHPTTRPAPNRSLRPVVPKSQTWSAGHDSKPSPHFVHSSTFLSTHKPNVNRDRARARSNKSTSYPAGSA